MFKSTKFGSLTVKAMRTQNMGSFRFSAARAVDNGGNILEGFACQLPMSFLHVGCFLLRNGLQDSFPYI